MSSQYEIAVSPKSRIRWLLPAIKKWAEHHIAYCNLMAHPAEEVSYYYNERANIGLLAAGAWSAKPKMIALEEYVEYKKSKIDRRKKSIGRIDLYIAENDARGTDCVIEAKQTWPKIKSSGDFLIAETFAKSVAALEEALDDVSRSGYDKKQTVGCVFMTIKFASQSGWATENSSQIKKLRSWVRSRKLGAINLDVLAACFPKSTRTFTGPDRSTAKYYWPCVAMALKVPD